MGENAHQFFPQLSTVEFVGREDEIHPLNYATSIEAVLESKHSHCLLVNASPIYSTLAIVIISPLKPEVSTIFLSESYIGVLIWAIGVTVMQRL